MKENKPRSRSPWTEEEDRKLKSYFDGKHEEAHWDTVASQLGLRRSGNSARLRWINYLKPGVRRRNITDEEMLSILLLQFKWGNKWSKIARQLVPAGRRDNEVKNVWYTRVKREANELNCKVGSHEFLRTMAKILVQRIESVNFRMFSPTAYDELITLFPELATAGGGSATSAVNHAEFGAADAQEQFHETRELRTYEEQEQKHQPSDQLLRIGPIGGGAVAAAGFHQMLEAAMQAPSVVAGGHSPPPAVDYFGFLDPEYGDFGHFWSPDDPNKNRLGAL